MKPFEIPLKEKNYICVAAMIVVVPMLPSWHENLGPTVSQN